MSALIQESVYIGIITDIFENYVVCSFVDKDGEPFYKQIPKKLLNFQYSCYDYIRVTFKKFENKELELIIEKYTPMYDEEVKQGIIRQIKERKNNPNFESV